MFERSLEILMYRCYRFSEIIFQLLTAQCNILQHVLYKNSLVGIINIYTIKTL